MLRELNWTSPLRCGGRLLHWLCVGCLLWSTNARSQAEEISAIVFPYLDAGYRFKVVGYDGGWGFEEPNYNDSDFSIGAAAFGTTTTGWCALNHPDYVKTYWPLFTDILVRRQFFLPAGVDRVEIGVAIDNHVQVFMNGHDVSGGLRLHYGCPTTDSFVFTAPSRFLNAGANILAVRGRDAGDVCYLDVQLKAYYPLGVRVATFITLPGSLTTETQTFRPIDFVIAIPQGQVNNLLVRITPLEGTGEWRLLGRRNRLPELGSSDWYSDKMTPFGTVELTIPQAESGYYCFTVYYSDWQLGQAGRFKIEVRPVDFHVSDFQPRRAGNAGNMTLRLRGIGFTTETVTRLTGPQSVVGGSPILSDSTDMCVTFDLRGAIPSTYTLQVEKPGTAPLSLQNAFVVTPGVGPRLEARLSVPPETRPGRQYSVTVYLKNSGDSDSPLPAVVLDFDGAPAVRFPPNVPNIGNFCTLIPVPKSGLPVIRPGENVSVPLIVTMPVNTTALDCRMELVWPSTLLSLAINYGQISMPPGADPLAWAHYLREMQNQYGLSIGSYFASLLDDLPHISQHYSSMYNGIANVNGSWTMIPEAIDEVDPVPPLELSPELKKRYVTEEMNARSPKTGIPSRQATPADGVTQTYVVIIADGDYTTNYPTGNKNLNAPRSGDAYQDYFRYTLGIPADRVTALIDRVGDNVTLSPENVYPAIRALAGKTDADDQLVIVYNGHGAADGTILLNNGIITPAGLAGEINAVAPGSVYMINDSCHAGMFDDSLDILLSSKFLGMAAERDCLSYGSSNGGVFGWTLLTYLLMSDSLEEAFRHADAEWQSIQDAHLTDNDGVGMQGNPWAERLSLREKILEQLMESYDMRDPWLIEHMIRIIRPIDPNEKVGTVGAGDPVTQRHVSAGSELYYTVIFENQSTATAPAQEIVISDYLDSDLDWSTFQLGEVAWGNHVVTSLAGKDAAFTRTDLTSSSYVVDIDAQLYPLSGMVRWTLRTVNPATNELTTDPLAGFLPPNNATGRGEGHVSFTVRARANLSPGSRLTNKASIAFDVEAAMQTNEVFNTIAPDPPYAPVGPSPGNAARNVPATTFLSCAPSTFAIAYDIYFWRTGQAKPSVPTVSGLDTPFYDPPGELAHNAGYSWQVVARNVVGGRVGPEWRFTTAGSTYVQRWELYD